MRRLPAFPLLALLLAACSGPVGAEASCIHLVKAGGIFFTWAPGLPAREYPVGAEFARTQRNRECNDQGLAESEPWREGDATGFAPGTALHRYEGHPLSERLLVFNGGQWRELRPIENQ